MIDIETYRKLALSFPDTHEEPHFDHPSFRIGKKIFATYWTKENRAMLRLSEVDQSVFCGYDPSVFFPVNGTWGKQGATFVELSKVDKEMFTDALTTAYHFVAKKK
jgi:hypothetical protein